MRTNVLEIWPCVFLSRKVLKVADMNNSESQTRAPRHEYLSPATWTQVWCQMTQVWSRSTQFGVTWHQFVSVDTNHCVWLSQLVSGDIGVGVVNWTPFIANWCRATQPVLSIATLLGCRVTRLASQTCQLTPFDMSYITQRFVFALWSVYILLTRWLP